MHLFFLIFFSIVFPQFSYSSSGGCQEIISRMIDESVALVGQVGRDINSSQSQDRLQGLKTIRELQLDVEPIYLEVLSLVQDPDPEVRVEAVRFLEQYDFVNIQAVYTMQSQLQKEDDSYVYRIIEEAVDDVYMKLWERALSIGSKMEKYLLALTFVTEKAIHLIKKMGFTENQWLEILRRALSKGPERRTIMEELAVEIQNEYSSFEDDFRVFINSLHFESSREFFIFLANYKKFTGKDIKINKQTVMAVVRIYSEFKR